MKTCSECYSELPETTEYFFKGAGKNGLRSKCKKCLGKQVSKRRKRKVFIAGDSTKNKQCVVCKKEYPATLDNFFAEPMGKYGLRTKCKKCFGIESKKSKSTPEAKKKSLESGRKHYKNNKAKYAERWQEYYAQNAEHLKEKARKYGKENRDKGRKNDRKRRMNPQFRLHSNVSRAIRQSLSMHNNKKDAPWLSLVDYNIKKLKTHIEKQFQEGMTWENYGLWHLDHVIPQSVFNFTKPEHNDFKRCWALDNLQPLWAKENISKGAKLDKHFQPSLLI